MNTFWTYFLRFFSIIKDEKTIDLVPNKKKPVCTGFFEELILRAVEIEWHDWVFPVEWLCNYKLHPSITILRCGTS